MKGQYHIIVQNKRLRYEFDIRRNITIIRGGSATGKTTLYSMIALVARMGESSGVELQCEKRCRTLDGPDLPNLPYSVEEIYGIHTSGKYHDMKKVYNEFYHIYSVQDISEKMRVDEIIVEDSNSGYEFFDHVCKEKGILCENAGGKSKIIDVLQESTFKNVLVIADGASIGPEMNELFQYMKAHPCTKCYLPESFEWMILKSGMIDGNVVQDILQHPQDFIESQEYFNWERFFTGMLMQYTQGTYLQYTKHKLNEAYLHERSKRAILDVMIKIDEKQLTDNGRRRVDDVQNFSCGR